MRAGRRERPVGPRAFPSGRFGSNRLKRIGTFVVVASFVFASTLPAAAQTAGRSLAAAAVAASMYAGFGSKECLKSPPNIRPDSAGTCSRGAWDRYEASRRKTQVAGGMLAAGLSSIFLFKPASHMAEGWSYLAMGGGMLAGAFDYRCRGVRTYHYGCVDTRRGRNFGGDGTEATFERPSLAYGGMAMIALGVARMLMPDERAPNWEIGAAPDGFRIARVVGW